MLYARFTLIGSWKGGNNFGVGIALNKNVPGYRKQTTFFLMPYKGVGTHLYVGTNTQIT